MLWPLGIIGRVFLKSPPKPKVLLPIGMSHSPVRSLMHLSMVYIARWDITEASSKINMWIPFISYPTLLFRPILQLLPSLHGTGTLNMEWMVQPSFNNTTATPVHSAIFALQPLVTTLFLIWLKRNVCPVLPAASTKYILVHPGIRLFSAIRQASVTEFRTSWEILLCSSLSKGSAWFVLMTASF